MIKICVLTTVHNLLDTRIFAKEVKTLKEAGYDVTLIAQHERNQIIDGIKVIALPIVQGRAKRMIYLTCVLFKLALKEQASIYHFHDPELIPVGIMLKLFHKRVIYDVHEDVEKDILSKEWIPKSLRWLVSKVVRLIEAFSTVVFDGIIAATPAIAKKFPVHKTVIVQNFPIIHELITKEASFYHHRPKNIVYVGDITRVRGIKEIVGALELLDDREVKLVLAGTFSPLVLEKEICELEGWKYVQYVGWQSRSSLRAIFGEARAGLVLFHPEPNHLEAWPNKLFEYMSAGLPVIASNFPLWREIIENERCGLLINPLDPKAIAEVIKWVMENPDEAQKMGRRGQVAVSNRYNWHEESMKLVTFYRRFL